MEQQAQGYLAITIAIIGWGASSPLIELGLRTGVSALPFLAYRFLLASILLTPYVLIKRKDVLKLFTKPLVWIVGLSESIGLILQYLGQQQQVPAGLAALLSLLFLLIVPFLSPFVLDETFKAQYLLSVLLALIGVIFISSEGDINGLFSGNISILGVILLIFAAVGYAFYIVFTSKVRLTDETVDTFGLFYVVLVMVAGSSLIVSFFWTGLSPMQSDTYLWLVLLVIFSTLIAFVTYFEAMRTINANVASVLLLMQVFVAFVIDFIFLHTTYNFWVLIGSIIIFAAMIIAVTTPTAD